MDQIKNSSGKMFLYKENGKIIGLIVGLIIDQVDEYDFRAPKRGRVTELIVSKNSRSKGNGKALLAAMENFFKSQGCKNIIIGVFGYNQNAIEFYEKNGYHTRLIETTKNL